MTTTGRDRKVARSANRSTDDAAPSARWLVDEPSAGARPGARSGPGAGPGCPLRTRPPIFREPSETAVEPVRAPAHRRGRPAPGSAPPAAPRGGAPRRRPRRRVAVRRSSCVEAGGRFDVLILDVGLPDVDGFEVARRMRHRGSRVPILMLTARDGRRRPDLGLDAGADDYLVKPFAYEELSRARLRALGRRAAGAAPGAAPHPGGGRSPSTKRAEWSRSTATRRAHAPRVRAARVPAAPPGPGPHPRPAARHGLAVRRRGDRRTRSMRSSRSCGASLGRRAPPGSRPSAASATGWPK